MQGPSESSATESDLAHIARTMEMMMTAMTQQQQATRECLEATRTAVEIARMNTPWNVHGPSEFLKGDPPKFNGESGPDVADLWIREIEKIFRTMDCPEDKKVIFATFVLVGEAEYWWQGNQRLMEAQGEAITWTSFKESFLKKYFPISERNLKETEFLKLIQGDMTVHKYIIKFEYLSRFYTQPMSEEWKCRKFEEGLKPEIKKVVIPMSIRIFLDLVEKAKVVERFENEIRVIRDDGAETSGSKKRYLEKKSYDQPFGQSRYVRPSPSIEDFVVSSQPKEHIESSVEHSESSVLICFRCGGPHHIRDCPHKNRVCYSCQKTGHLARDCRGLSRSTTSKKVMKPSRSKATKRVD